MSVENIISRALTEGLYWLMQFDPVVYLGVVAALPMVVFAVFFYSFVGARHLILGGRK
jgi:hypothetical protein